MSSLCQYRVIIFHSELRRRTVDSILNSKRLKTINKCTNEQRICVLDRKEIIKLVKELEERKNCHQGLKILLADIRGKYIYNKANMAMLKPLIKTLIHLSSSLYPLMKFDSDLIYDLSWVLINFIGFEDCEFDLLTIETLCGFFLFQMHFQSQKIQEMGLWGLSNLFADTHVQRVYELLRFDFPNEIIVFFTKNNEKTENYIVFLRCLKNLLIIEASIPEKQIEAISTIIRAIIEKNKESMKIVAKCIKILKISAVKIKSEDLFFEDFMKINSSSLMEITQIIKQKQNDRKIYLEALQLFAIIAKGEENIVQILLEIGVLEILWLPEFEKIEEDTQVLILKVISSIVKGPINFFFRDLTFFKFLFRNSIFSKNENIREGFLLVLLEICKRADFEQVFQLTRMGILEIIIGNLESGSRCLKELIEALKNLFECGELEELNLFENPFVRMFEELGGISLLEGKLHTCACEEAYLAIESLIELYF